MKISDRVRQTVSDILWLSPAILAMLLVSFMTIIGSVSADTLELPTDIGASNEVNISKPTRGMTMDEVTVAYGEPDEIMPPVGDPPITRWVYAKFVVHFERQYVIFAVTKKKQR